MPSLFGERANGSPVMAIEIRNSNGMSARVITLGATVQSLNVPDRKGSTADVVLGHSAVAEYESKRQYLGATVGRYANRILHGTFVLEGERVVLDINDGANHLHGGFHGFDFANWTIESADAHEAVLSHESVNGEGGYPGTMRVTATFSLSEDNALTIDYLATTDRLTIANITHHGYFNLTGENSGESVLDHRLTLHASQFTPIDSFSIPTGEVRDVRGSAFDFTVGKRIGESLFEVSNQQLLCGQGYDHNFIVDGEVGTLRSMAILEDSHSGRSMELLSTAPGVQFYSGNFLDGTTCGKQSTPYRRHSGLCLEPQWFPDSPNRPAFPSVVLRPGEVFSNRIVLKFFSRPVSN